MAASPSTTYCNERPARMIAVMRENTTVIFSLSHPSAATAGYRLMPVANITASSAA